MESKISHKLTDVSETLLIPLWARAVETKRKHPIIKDKKSVEIMERIDYDFSKYNNVWISQVGVSIRTMLLDRASNSFIERNPDAVIINLGAGLDTRFGRVDNGNIYWYDLDLPEVIRIREQFFSETDRYKMIAKSVFDYSWISEITISNQPVLIIAEGILMYFNEQEVKSLFNRLVAAFPGADMLFEMMPPALAKNSAHHDTIKTMNTEFQWGINSGKALEKFNDKIQFIEEWNYFDFHKDRWRWLRWIALIPALKKRFNNRIVHLGFAGNVRKTGGVIYER